MSCSLVYMTASSQGEAEALGRMLVERRLAACVNLIGDVNSMYWWKGRVERAQEVVLVAKTRTELVAELTSAVKAAHSYECPCVVSVPIGSGNPDFLAWIMDEARGRP
ncbi:MAG: divalent-cation tolerance protein CutA [Desulfovibrionaceae bacterium]|nr:divalent-cation tolerance protein CutA [Desulfovibrionaceae bacterium]